MIGRSRASTASSFRNSRKPSCARSFSMSASAARCSTIGASARCVDAKGVAALFTGESGTGKTMAAHAIASELETDLYAVDLAQIVSEIYRRDREEPRHHLRRRRARRRACCCSTRPTHCSASEARSATRTTATPTSRSPICSSGCSSFAGLAILTTNHPENIDPAFTRRLRFNVDFPRPSAADRLRIWEQSIPPPIARRVARSQAPRLRARRHRRQRSARWRSTPRCWLRKRGRRSPSTMSSPALAAELIRLGSYGDLAEARRAVARGPAGEGRLMAIDAVTAAIMDLLKDSLGNEAGHAARARSTSSFGPPERRGSERRPRPVPLSHHARAPSCAMPSACAPSRAKRTPPRLLEPAVPLDLHYLLTTGGRRGVVDRKGSSRLGRCASGPSRRPRRSSCPSAFQAAVWLSLLPMTTDELSRIWGLFPNENCRTSFAFRASPVWIDPREPAVAGAAGDRPTRRDAGRMMEPALRWRAPPSACTRPTRSSAASMFALELVDPVTGRLASEDMIVTAPGLAPPRPLGLRSLRLDRRRPARQAHGEGQGDVASGASSRRSRSDFEVPARGAGVTAADLIWRFALEPTGLYAPPAGMLAAAGMLIDAATDRTPLAGVAVTLQFRDASDASVLASNYVARTDERGQFVAVAPALGGGPMPLPPPDAAAEARRLARDHERRARDPLHAAPAAAQGPHAPTAEAACLGRPPERRAASAAMSPSATRRLAAYRGDER